MARRTEEEEASTSSSEHDAHDGSSDDQSSESGDEHDAHDDDESEQSIDDSDDGETDEESEPNSNQADESTAATSSESCTFELADLASFNTHQINAAQLYTSTSSNNNDWYSSSSCIDSPSLPINEALLLQKAIRGTQPLLRHLWQLDSHRTDGVLLARLPSRSSYTLPRALPPPPPKAPTKWELFAQQRGIAPKSKRSRKEFDPATGTWKHITGYDTRSDNDPASWPILEVKRNDDPNADPWEKLKEEKQKKRDKNTVNRVRNAERAGLLEKGAGRQLAKQLQGMEAQRKVSREKERENAILPTGVPVDMHQKQRGKPSITSALQAAQSSTASMGKFDQMRLGEPERRSLVTSKKRKSVNTTTTTSSNEQQTSRDILQKVMNGSSSKEKEREIKRGKFAKGETAYDYEFEDGLGSGSFRKKKGRAGSGKMRKITKKRIK